MKKFLLIFLIVNASINFSCDKADDPDHFEWPVSTPAAEGLNVQKIDSAYLKARDLGFVDALLIIRNGKLVSEGYYNGYDREKGHQIWSCTKSFMSALVGIAIDISLIESVDKKIMDYFPEYAYYGMDARFYEVTIEHLLKMSMGIDNEEINLIPVVQTNDWVYETFRLPLMFDPGQKFRYNSLETHLLSVILTKVSGKSALEFAKEYLTGPMGIDIVDWKNDPKGYNTGGYDIYMKPRDMAVLGYMYLNGGKINNTQVVPEEWINASLTRTWVNSGIQWGPLTDYNYGYLWWLGKISGYEMFMAMGMGGQNIITFPELDLIVVTTTNKDISWDNDQEIPTLEIVSDFILKAL
jgi:CubicO group peptidase (beta-lactamase class C family)